MDAASIVIAGYGFALPGAGTPHELATVLREGRICYGDFPAERIDPDIYFDPQARQGDARLSSLRGGALADSGPHNATVARTWLLEALDRALRSAQLSKEATTGQAAPIFLAHSRGGGPAIYDAGLLAAADDLLPALVAGAHPDEFSFTELAVIAAEVRASLAKTLHPGRAGARALHRLPAALAGALGTTGKAIVVDGNCTGGLAALDMAAFDVAQGAPFALAGALSYVDTVNQVLYSNAGLLAREGCFPFTDDNGGTVISDGVVLLVVTTLGYAVGHGLPVRAIVRGIGGANDGARERYMLSPSPRGHSLAIARAHESAGIVPGTVDLYLTHGSGTRVGDAIEAEVFNSYIRAHGGAPQPIPIRSIKGHIGHAKEAAGLANLVAALALFEAEALFQPVRPNNARAAFDRFSAVNVGPTDPHHASADRVSPRRAGISAIASGGQNYHVLVEAPPATLPAAPRVTAGAGATESIAIVGMAARFADAPDLETLHRNLLQGHRPFRPQPLSAGWSGLAEEADAQEAWRREHPGIYTSFGARLALDPLVWARRAAAFGERPADIARHDPLHYLMIDLARQAARSSAVSPGSNVAVVLAADHCSDFGLKQVAAARLPEIEHHLRGAMAERGRCPRERERTVKTAMRCLAADLPPLSASSLFNLSPSFTAARIARAFDLTGPICAVEAGGGASFIAALEVAGRRLADPAVDAVLCASAEMRSGVSRLAEECALGQVSRSDRPIAFAGTSDGYLPGEGASVFVLRRLADARRRGDPILGVIHGIGSAVATDMASQLVSTAALEQAIRAAHAKAGVTPDEVAFVEGFGCGVPSADRAEIAAIAAAFRGRREVLPLGSVMPDIGHCGASAAAGSLIKALFALNQGEIPPTRGADPAFAEGDGIVIPTSPLGVPQARYAAINAASPGGTHYHVIIAGAPRG
ncbi:beta-ketoacyl synthase N-terminal-like domain-containing protein [Sphingomonas sp. MMS24-J45]|uniref:beta-ketoacyl synthase N-terminal-like domain-containing protein n=1 Tax=Sphingomonas sp. MMS24-J45 TaxID=3238806 RepID=UPI00384ECB28